MLDHNQVAGLMRVGRLTAVGAEAAMAALDRGDPAGAAQIVAQDGASQFAHARLPNPAFYRSARETSRRAPLGFKQDGSGASFFTLLAGVGQIVTMSGKVSRVAHIDRLVIIPSAPGAVVNSIMIGDEEQVLSPGAPVELYSDFALTDPLPDDFSPLQSALDFKIVLMNTTAAQITGTIGCKARVER